MQSIYDTVPKDFLISTTLDDHQYVKKLNDSNESDPNYKKNLINAYIVRDVKFCGNKTIKQLFEEHCNKLGLNSSEEDIVSKRTYQFMQNIKEMVSKKEFIEESIKDYYFSIINQNETDKEVSNRQRYNTIMSQIENGGQIEDIYEHFSVADLQHIGW